MITFNDFQKVDMRVGRVVGVEDFPRARNPSYKFEIDFDPEIGTRFSSAQLANYSKSELVGQQVVAVVNFPPRNVAGFISEVLILGVPMESGTVSLLEPRDEAITGGRVY